MKKIQALLFVMALTLTSAIQAKSKSKTLSHPLYIENLMYEPIKKITLQLGHRRRTYKKIRPQAHRGDYFIGTMDRFSGKNVYVTVETKSQRFTDQIHFPAHDSNKPGVTILSLNTGRVKRVVVYPQTSLRGLKLGNMLASTR